MEKRYCIQMRETEDRQTGIITWKNTNKCSNDLNALRQLCGSRSRIFDRETGKVIYDPAAP